MERHFISVDKNNIVVLARTMYYYAEPNEEEAKIDATYISVSKPPEQYLDMKYISDTKQFVHTAVTGRKLRDEKLKEVDIVAGNTLRWNALTESKQNEWSTYRQNLLDVPAQSSFPENISWPTKPE